MIPGYLPAFVDFEDLPNPGNAFGIIPGALLALPSRHRAAATIPRGPRNLSMPHLPPEGAFPIQASHLPPTHTEMITSPQPHNPHPPPDPLPPPPHSTPHTRPPQGSGLTPAGRGQIPVPWLAGRCALTALPYTRLPDFTPPPRRAARMWTGSPIGKMTHSTCGDGIQKISTITWFADCILQGLWITIICFAKCILQGLRRLQGSWAALA